MLFQQEKGDFVRTVSTQLKKDDLLILAVSTHPSLKLRTPAVGKQPEAIARTHPDLSILILHFPSMKIN